MGCEVVVAGASAAELELIARLFEERDATFSRFREESELRRVNRVGWRDARLARRSPAQSRPRCGRET